jgi:hypothetical protein
MIGVNNCYIVSFRSGDVSLLRQYYWSNFVSLKASSDGQHNYRLIFCCHCQVVSDRLIVGFRLLHSLYFIFEVTCFVLYNYVRSLPLSVTEKPAHLVSCGQGWCNNFRQTLTRACVKTAIRLFMSSPEGEGVYSINQLSELHYCLLSVSRENKSHCSSSAALTILRQIRVCGWLKLNRRRQKARTCTILQYGRIGANHIVLKKIRLAFGETIPFSIILLYELCHLDTL